MEIGDIVSWDRERAAVVEAGGLAVTPEVVRVTVRLPRGVFVWARPAAAVVDAGAGEERIPIVNVVRWAQVAGWLAVLLYGLARRAQRRGGR